MFKQKAPKVVTRRVWRMTPDNPAGEFVSPTQRRAAAQPADVHQPGLHESSFDLLGGVELTETEMTNLPGEFVDELLKGAFESR